MSFKKINFKKCKDLILGIVLLALGILYTVYSTQIKTRPKLTPSYASAQVFPRLLGILLIILSALLIVQGIRIMLRKDEKDAEAPSKKVNLVDISSVALTFAAMVLYIVILQYLGFILSTMIFLFAQITILAPKEKRNFLLFAIVAVVFTIIAFVAFRIGLSQLLPRGPIEALIGY